MTTLIKLNDNTLVEADISNDDVEQVSGSTANKVNSSLKSITPIIVNACDPIVESLSKISNKPLIQSVEIDIGLGFEGEGNLYITKAKC